MVNADTSITTALTDGKVAVTVGLNTSGLAGAEYQIGYDDSKLVLPASAYKSIDNATMGNADGWYSINNVEFKRITANFKKAQEAAVAGKPQIDTTPKTSTTEATDFLQIASTKSINFYLFKLFKNIL